MKKSLIILLLLLASCSPQKRVAKLIRKHPDILKNYNVKINVKDTIYHLDTFITPSKELNFYVTDKDTDIVIKKDTIFKRGNAFKIKLGKDTFYKRDTIYFSKEIIVPGKVIDTTPKWVYWIKDNLLLLAFLTLCLTLIIKYFKKNTSGGV